MSDAMKRFIDELGAALAARGLVARTESSAVTAVNSAVVGGEVGGILSPALTQRVVLTRVCGETCGQDCAEHRVGWHYEWPGLDTGQRDVPDPAPTYEWICPPDEVGVVADRLAKIVRTSDVQDFDA